MVCTRKAQETPKRTHRWAHPGDGRRDGKRHKLRREDDSSATQHQTREKGQLQKLSQENLGLGGLVAINGCIDFGKCVSEGSFGEHVSKQIGNSKGNCEGVLEGRGSKNGQDYLVSNEATNAAEQGAGGKKATGFQKGQDQTPL